MTPLTLPSRSVRARLRRLGRRFVRGDGGAAMVEFALATPLLLTMAFGVIDFGRAFYVYNKLSSVVRDGARLGAAQGATATQATVTSRITGAILAEYDLTGARAPNVSVQVTNTDVVVSVQNYAFTSWLPILPIARNLTLSTTATFRREVF
jgi:Flp pilus assembly protein TadG